MAQRDLAAGAGLSTDVSRPAAWAILSALLLLGAGLRIFFLDSALWYDEIKTLLDNVRPPLVEIATNSLKNTDHVLFSLLSHFSVAAFGEHAWSLRLPAAFFGIATIPLLYLFGARVTGRLEALSATCLLTLSYHHIWFSQNARSYTLVLFVTLLGSYLLLVGLQDNRRSAFLGYAVVAALSVYAHLVMIFVIFGQAVAATVYVVWEGKGGSGSNDWKNPLLGFGIAGLLIFLTYALILAEPQTFFEHNPIPAEKRVATPLWALLATLKGLNIGLAMAGAAVLGGIVGLAGCWSFFRRSPAVGVLFLLPVLVLLVTALNLQRPVFPRFFIFFMGFALLIAVRGATVTGNWIADRTRFLAIGRRFGPRLPVVLVAGMVALSALALPYVYRYPKQNYDEALRYVENAKRENDTVVVVGGGTTLPYQRYYERPWQRIDSAEQLNAVRARHSAVWLLYTFRQYIRNRQPELLDAILNECKPAKSIPATVAGGRIDIFRCATL